MNKVAPETAYLAQSLYCLHEDLGAFTFAQVLRGGFEHYIGVCSGFPVEINSSLSHYIELALSGAKNVITNHKLAEAIPKYPLTAAAVNTARTTNSLDAGKKGARLCLSSELKIKHSLELNNVGERPGHGMPAAVLFDVNRDPFAYIKAVGTHAALSWRDAAINTTDGPRFIPAGAFFRVGYGPQGVDDVQKTLRNVGGKTSLVSLEDYGPPSDVRLIRFSTFLIDNELAESAFLYETGPNVFRNPYEYLNGYIPSVVEGGVEGIGDQVQSLISQGKVFELNQSNISA